MSFPIEAEAAALAQTLLRVEPDLTADRVDTLSLLDRLLTASVSGVDNPTDAHWVLVRKMLLAKAAKAETEEEPACP